MNIELRHIRYFLTVAEEKNFTRAAQRLCMSQPPLSMQIRDLEECIGADLFLRTSQGVVLTEVGQAFLTAVEPLQHQLDDAIQLARHVSNGEVGQLRLGFTGTSMLNPLIPESIRRYQQQYPQVGLKLEEANSLKLIDYVLEDRLDIAIIRPPRQIHSSLAMQQLLNEALIAAVSVRRDLAQGEQPLQVTCLREHEMILSPRSVSAGLYDAVTDACQQAGFEPKMGQSAPQIVSILSLVAANLGVSMVPESSQQLQIQGVVYRPFAEPVPTVGLAVIYKQDLATQLAINFASILQMVCHQDAKHSSESI